MSVLISFSKWDVIYRAWTVEIYLYPDSCNSVTLHMLFLLHGMTFPLVWLCRLALTHPQRLSSGWVFIVKSVLNVPALLSTFFLWAVLVRVMWWDMSFQILANCFCHPRFGVGMGFLMYQARDDIILSWILNFKILGPSGNDKAYQRFSTCGFLWLITML